MVGGCGRLVLAVWCTFAMLLTAAPAAAEDGATRRVLLLDSYGPRMNWTRDIIRAVEDEFGLRESGPSANGAELELYIEFLDSKLFSGDSYLNHVADVYQHKYGNLDLDLILCAHNNALAFLKARRDSLFPGVPIVFAGINEYHPVLIEGMGEVTGVAEAYSVRATVDAMLALHPETRTLYVINDYLTTGRAQEGDIQTQLKGLDPAVELVYAPDSTVAELHDTLAQLKPNTLVLLGVYFADRDGFHSNYADMSARITARSAAPVYCLLRDNVGHGCVGGRVVSAYEHGQKMAQVAKRVLAGERPSAIPVQGLEANPWKFDHGELERWDISESSLPVGSEVLNRPFSVWVEYRREIIAVGAVLFLMSLTIGFLVLAIRARRRVETQLRESEERISTTLNSIGDGVLATNDVGRIMGMNPQATALTGWAPEDAAGRPLAEVVRVTTADTDEAWPDLAKTVLARGEVVTSARGKLKARDGSERLVDATSAPIRVGDGALGGVVLVLRDVTQRAEMESRLLHSQKMEAVGQLAGGVAHDFNNILTGIMGFTELLGSGLCSPDESTRFVARIQQAATRARDLTRKLLDFSRKGRVSSEPTDIHRLLEETADILQPSIGRRIELALQLDARRTTVVGDATQLQQALLNLGVNARDAMDGQGKLTIATANRHLTADICAGTPYDIGTGDFLEIAIEDTGTGIPQAVITRIFEPFFTTKPVGEGTGLGLAAVHGTVQDHHGYLAVESEEGVGTTFRLYLPLSEARLGAEESLSAPTPMAGGTVLIVDDEEPIRDMASALLQQAGYDVLTAADGREGAAEFRRHKNEITAVLLDIIMPEMSGPECLREIRSLSAETRIVLASGFTATNAVSELLRDPHTVFVPKPYQRATLLDALAGGDPGRLQP